MRCLALADAVARRGGKCVFGVRELPAKLAERLTQFGHRLLPIEHGARARAAPGPQLAHEDWLPTTPEQDAADVLWTLAEAELLGEVLGRGKRYFDAVVLDHYALDRRWEQPMRQIADCIIVIDDLADRTHDCDLLIDQNPGRKSSDYRALLPESATILAGPDFALLREEFIAARDESFARRSVGEVAHGLISLGGVDSPNLTGACLSALQGCTLRPETRLTVILGAQCPHIQVIRDQAAACPWPVDIVVDTDRMASHMAAADWAIGAAGLSALERCCVGLPSLVLVQADNQLPGARELAREKAAVVLPYPLPAKEFTAAFHNGMRHLFEAAPSLSQASSALCDGKGLDRIVAAIETHVRATA